MPRAAKDAKVEAPDEIEKLRQWLRSTYEGQDLPEAEKWRALQRTRSGESSKSRGAVDLFYCTPDEPPKVLTSRLEVARHLGLAAPKPAAPKRKAAAPAEEEEWLDSDDDSRGSPVAPHAPADLSRLRPEQLLEAALARRTPHASATALKAAAARPLAKAPKLDARPLLPKPPPAKPKPPPRAPSPPPPPPKPKPAAPPPAVPAKAAGAPSAPLYKRPVATSRAARPPGAAPAAEAAPARATHACSLSCPLQCPGWVGLAALAATGRAA